MNIIRGHWEEKLFLKPTQLRVSQHILWLTFHKHVHCLTDKSFFVLIYLDVRTNYIYLPIYLPVSSDWPASLHYCNMYLYCTLTIFTRLYIYLTHLTDRGLLHHSDRYRHPAWQEDRWLLPHLAQHWSVQRVKIKINAIKDNITITKLCWEQYTCIHYQT